MSPRCASGRKRRKLNAVDEQVKTPTDSSTGAANASLKLAKNASGNRQKSSPDDYKGLFGKLINVDNTCTSTPLRKNASVNETPMTRKKTQLLSKEPVETKMTKPLIIDTPRSVKRKRVQADLSIDSNNSNLDSRNESVVSNDNINISGIQCLPQSSSSSLLSAEPTKLNVDVSTNEKVMTTVLDGVFPFVDYKLEMHGNTNCIIEYLKLMGAKIQKTFNLKVTVVVFLNGSPKTYNTAMERNIPLVSAAWVDRCYRTKTLMDPLRFPAVVSIEKYNKTPPEVNYAQQLQNFRISGKWKKFITKESISKHKSLLAECKRYRTPIKNVDMESQIDKDNDGLEKDLCDCSKINNIINSIPGELHNLYKNCDSPNLDVQTDDLCEPKSIKSLKAFLIPDGNEKKTSKEIDSKLVQVENRLHLNSQDRQRLRKILFSSDKELYNMNIVKDSSVLSQSSQECTSDSLETSMNTSEQNIEFDKEILLQNKDVEKQNTNDNTVLPLQISSDLHLKQNCDQIKKCVTESTIGSTSSLSINSSMTVLNVETLSVAFTGMRKWEANIMKLRLKTLEVFSFHSKVQSSTSYLITKSVSTPTLDMVYAMAYGCYIVSDNWVNDSYDKSEFLSHEPYLITDLSEPVKEFQIQQHRSDSRLTFHIFDNAGFIFIANDCKPSARDLKQLVRLCGGKCTDVEKKANIMVGQMSCHVSTKWILDCIIQGTLLDTSLFINNSN